jgi:hypothetical protein
MHAWKQATGREPMVSLNKVWAHSDSRSCFEQVRETPPEIDILISFLSVGETLLYSPVKITPQVKAPIMIVAAENDFVNPLSRRSDRMTLCLATKRGTRRRATGITTYIRCLILKRLRNSISLGSTTTSTHDCCRSYRRAGFPMRRRQLFAFAS